MNDSQMKGRARSGAGAALILASAVLACFLFPGKAGAGTILDAELRFTYEDNVVGLLSDQPQGRGGNVSPTMMAMGGSMGGGNGRYTGAGSSTQSPGDFSATLSAEAGKYESLGKSSEIFAKGFAEHTSYDTYTDLDATIGGVSAGINANLSDTISGRVALIGKVKRFGDSQRDSTSYGGTVGVKEKLAREFWLREFVEYEINHADNPGFSYSGTTLGAGAGYELTRNTLLALGYSYLVQEYNEPSGAEMKTNTVYVSAEQTLTRSWSVAGEYDLQVSKTNIAGTSTIDDIFSVALRYSY
ncbi:MAG: hypothetical protein M0Z89_09815 [Nitrospiraceae bacterium]|nr:hypothetical protein [Nitrospiraceae bacterium]